MAAVVAKLREFAPYAAMELVMPGGSLMAFGLWWLRHRPKRTSSADSSIDRSAHAWE
jgi:hypothetical protein